MKKNVRSLAVVSALLVSSVSVQAKPNNDCKDLPSHAELKAALTTATLSTNGGLDFDMWATVVNRFGAVCAIVKAVNSATNNSEPDPWPGSRVISAQKANTANSFSNRQVSWSSASLYGVSQPGGSLFGLQESNPVDPRAAYRGNAAQYGEHNDPMNGMKVGGINVFGGGLALYDVDGDVIGAIGVSGDTSCADHNVAWRTRAEISQHKGAPTYDGFVNLEKITYDAENTAGTIGAAMTNGFTHPLCGFAEKTVGESQGSVTMPPAPPAS